MSRRDPYDVSVAFDDIYGAADSAPEMDVIGATRAILDRARRTRFRQPPARFEMLGEGAAQLAAVVLGADEGVEGLPLFDAMRARFAAVMPKPIVARLDDEEGHAAFRDERRRPYIAQLEERLRALEAAHALHVADNHGARLDQLEWAFEDHLREVLHGGEPVPLPLPPRAAGCVESWCDGGEVLCAIRLPGPDGRVRIATASESLSRGVGEAVGCAIAIGVEPEEVVAAAPLAAPVLGASSLLQRLCGVAPDILAAAGEEGIATGLVVPALDPPVAAAAGLLHRAGQGDRLARAELGELERSRGDVISRARAWLRSRRVR